MIDHSTDKYSSDGQGKTVLVTGASRGIGAATVQLLTQRGYTVIPHASGHSKAADEVASHIKTDFVWEDLSQSGAGERLFAKALLAAHGKIDAVVNNAGIYEATPLNDTDLWDKAWAQTLAVNVRAPADICRAAIHHMKEQGAGTLINIASRAGHRGDGPDHAAYAASKGAILAMTKTLARGYAGDGIHIYAIAPGWVETRMAPEDIQARKKAVDEIPVGHVAKPDEIAAFTEFLIKGECPSAVGATFDINGASYVR